MTLWAWPALAGLSVSVGAHVLAYVSPSWSPSQRILWLVPNLFVLWPAMILRSRSMWPRGPARTEADAEAGLAVFAAVPGLIWPLGALLVGYVAMNFFVCMGVLREGSPQVSADGQRYLDHKGRHVRDIGEAEYDRLSAAEVRLATGHLMLFHAVAAVYFVWVDPQRRRPERAT